MRLLIILFLLSSCATPHTRIIYSEAGGILAPITGATKSCTVYSTEGEDIEVTSLVFNSGEDNGTCVGTIKSKKQTPAP
jgi:hypothetical protein